MEKFVNSKFNKPKTMKDGYRSECIFCCRKNYYKNRDRKLKNIKNYNKQNTEKINIYEKSQRKND